MDAKRKQLSFINPIAPNLKTSSYIPLLQLNYQELIYQNMSSQNPTGNVPTDASYETEYVELSAQAYLARMSNRPAFAALNGLFSSFPAIKVFTSNAVPLLVSRDQAKNKKRVEAIAEYNGTGNN